MCQSKFFLYISIHYLHFLCYSTAQIKKIVIICLFSIYFFWYNMGIEFTLKEVFNMNYTRKKRISIHNIQSGMELASDVITTNGLLLITAHTVITQNHIFKLNLYQILSVDIKEYQDESILSYESADKESQIFNKKN